MILCLFGILDAVFYSFLCVESWPKSLILLKKNEVQNENFLEKKV